MDNDILDREKVMKGLGWCDVLWVLYKEELLEFEDEMFKRAIAIETETKKE